MNEDRKNFPGTAYCMCDPSCKHMEPTETVQRARGEKGCVHACTKYYKPLRHDADGLNLIRLDACVSC